MTKPKKIVLKNGVKWEVYFCVNGKGSKRDRRRFDKKIDAEYFLKNFNYRQSEEERALAQRQSDSKARTLESEAQYWMKIRGREISLSHLKRVKGILKSLLADYGDYSVLDINNSFLAELRNKLAARGLAPATINRWTNVLTTIVNFSFKHNRIASNPCSGFGLLNEFREEIFFWERDSVSHFLEFANSKYSKESGRRWAYVVYLLALNTGLRAGEIWGLKVKDVSFTRKYISIERQFLDRERMISSTKGKNIRKVPCNKLLALEIKELIRTSNLGKEDFLFSSEAGTPFSHANFRNRYFLVDLKESDVPVIRFHSLRHTALTLMVENGISLKVVQSIAGHADITTTMKYVHLLGNSIEEVASSFVLS